MASKHYTKLAVSKEVATPKNIFEVDVRFMFGDADNYSNERWLIEDKDLVLELCNMLRDLQTAPHSRDSLRFTPEEHPSFPKFVFVEDAGFFDEKDEYIYGEDVPIESWPCDIDGWGIGKVEAFNVTYYDISGKKFSVKLS